MGSPPADRWPQDHGGNVWEAADASRVKDFSASINPFGPPPGLWDEIEAAWPLIVHYPDRSCRRLVEALARRLRSPARALAVGNGSAELIDLVLRCLAPKRVLVCPPDFGLYTSLVPPGVDVHRVPRCEARSFGLDLQGLERAVRPGDLVVFSNPSNPAGALLPPERVLALADLCRERGARLVVDEAFMDFVPDQSVVGQAPFREELVVLRSLTKFYALPGLRIGFLVAAPCVAERIRSRQVPWSVNTLAQAAGAFCLAQEDWEIRARSALEAERRRFSAALERLPGVRPLPSAANYLLVELSPPAPAAGGVYRALADQGILVRHCGSFGLGDRFVRVAVRRPEENDRLVAALGTLLPARMAAP